MKAKWLLTAVMAILIVPSIHANTIFTVTLNTSPLVGSGAGPFSVAFQLNDGSGTNDGNNTATLTNFSFGGGSATGSPTLFGGAGGDLTGTVTLTDSDFFNAFIQGFSPGSSLSFLVDLTTNVDSGGIPDAFAFSILDANGFSIPTMDPSGADTLLTINIDSANPEILTYATDPSRNTLGGTGPAITMDAPVTSPVPEPASLLLLGTGLASLALAGCRRRK